MNRIQTRTWALKGSKWIEGEDKYYSHSIPSDTSTSKLPSEANYSDLIDLNCIVLLGVPGSGKTTELKIAKSTINKNNSIAETINLGQINSFEYLQNYLLETSKSLTKEKTSVVFFFDALDESPASVPVAFQWLISIVIQGKKIFESLGKQFFVRFSCRTADWLERFEDDLNNIWGKDHVGVYELPPLKTDEIVEFANEGKVNPTDFLNEVNNINCQPLAVRPVTLKMLLSIFKQDLKLPKDKAALYHQALLALCEESNLTRRLVGNTGVVSSSGRFELAAKMAAACILSNNSMIWDGTYTDALPSGAVSLNQITASNKTAESNHFLKSLQETLKTGIFFSSDNKIYSWSHLTFAEFLTAYYLTKKTSKIEEIKSFLVSKIPENNFIFPQLREVAGWVALLNEEFFDYLIATEPSLLLTSDVALTRDADKYRLTGALLDNLDQENLYDEYEWRSKYKTLNHPSLLNQLRVTVNNKSKSIFARRAAFDIAESCNLKEICSDLTNIVLDFSEDYNIRKGALRALLGLNPTQFIEDLKQLVKIDPKLDPDDEIKGEVLQFLWPKHLKPKELFEAFSLPQNSSLIGSYSVFLHNVDFSTLNEAGALEALCWLHKANEFNSEYHFKKIIDNLLVATWKLTPNKKIVSELTKCILWLQKNSPYFYLSNSVFTKLYLDDAYLKRHSLLVALLENSEFDTENIIDLTYRPWQILSPQDVLWLIDLYKDERFSNHKTILCKSILRLLNWDDNEGWKRLLDISDYDKDLAEIISHETYISLDSSHAKWQSEDYLRRKKQDEDNSTNLSPIEIAEISIKKTEESISYWWQLNLVLLGDPNKPDRISEFSGSLDKGIWNDLTQDSKNKILGFAKQYLLDFELSNSDHLQPNTFSRPAAAGYRAFHLLYTHDSETYQQIPSDVWLKWLESLLSFYSNELIDSEIHRHILSDAYSTAPSEFIKALNNFTEKKSDLYHSLNLCESWADENLLDQFWRLFKLNLDNGLNKNEIWKIFLNISYDPATTEALSKLNETLNPDIQKISSEDVKVVCLLFNSHTTVFFDTLEKLEITNNEVFKHILSELLDHINIGEFLKNNDENCFYLAKLYIWLQDVTDSNKTETTTNTSFDQTSFFLSRALNQLVLLGTKQAVEAIAWLTKKLPKTIWLKWSLNDAKEIQRKTFNDWPQAEEVLTRLNLFQNDSLQVEINTNQSKNNPLNLDTSFSISLETISEDYSIQESNQLKIIAVATEWFSKNGGISTFNRKLCIALARAGHKIYCFIPDATSSEIESAKAANINLVTCKPSPGIISYQEKLNAGPYPQINFQPDLIIGHSHITGPQALRLASQLYACPYVHVVHTLPDELEAHKPSDDDKSFSGRPSNGLMKLDLQKEICLKSALVITVGPVLYESVCTDLKMYEDQLKVINLNPGLDDDLFKVNSKATPDLPMTNRCRMSGRIDDNRIKGVDIAAYLAHECTNDPDLSRIKFIFRGFDASNMDRNFKELMNTLKINPTNITPKPFSTDEHDLIAEMHELSLVIMPSRCEAFGLVGLEAISAGIPTLISKKSGLGQLLLSLVDNERELSVCSKEYIKEIVLDTYNDHSATVPIWLNSLKIIISDRHAAFIKASKLRDELKNILTWSIAIHKLNPDLIKLKT